MTEKVGDPWARQSPDWLSYAFRQILPVFLMFPAFEIDYYPLTN